MAPPLPTPPACTSIESCSPNLLPLSMLMPPADPCSLPPTCVNTLLLPLPLLPAPPRPTRWALDNVAMPTTPACVNVLHELYKNPAYFEDQPKITTNTPGGYNATLGVDIGTGQGLGWVRGSGPGVGEGVRGLQRHAGGGHWHGSGPWVGEGVRAWGE